MNASISAQDPPANVARTMPVRTDGCSLGGAGTHSLWEPSAELATSNSADRRPETPDEVLAVLAEGNKRFLRGETITPHRSMARLREVAAVQNPFAVFLCCADSRVPIEIIFDQGFGDLFVTRIAGNLATPETIASLEFGSQILGAKVIYVLGHTACGAVTAAMQRAPVPGQIGALLEHLPPAVTSAGHDLDSAVRENVIHQARTLAETSPVIAALIAEGQLKVAGGVYDLVTGFVTTLPI